MICKDCRDNDHEACPEFARQGNTALSLAQRSASSWCDCSHMPRAVRSATLLRPIRATQ